MFTESSPVHVAAMMAEISSRERPVGMDSSPWIIRLTLDHTPHPLPVCAEPPPPDFHGGHPEVEPLPLLLVPQVSGKELAHVAVASRRQIPVELAQLGAEAPGVRKGVGVSVSV
jgi:hypothetical protein